MAVIKNEEQLQSACFIWFWNNYPRERQMLFHVNNNNLDRNHGALKKSLGVVKGVCDFILIADAGIVIFIELKFGSGILSEEQEKFKSKVIERGHTHKVFRTLEDFQKFIKVIYG